MRSRFCDRSAGSSWFVFYVPPASWLTLCRLFRLGCLTRAQGGWAAKMNSSLKSTKRASVKGGAPIQKISVEGRGHK